MKMYFILSVLFMLSLTSHASDSKGLYTESLGYNFDGSVTIHHPRVVVDDDFVPVASKKYVENENNSALGLCKLYGYKEFVQVRTITYHDTCAVLNSEGQLQEVIYGGDCSSISTLICR